jgi:DNA-binding CsgD family transcriptional regulator
MDARESGDRRALAVLDRVLELPGADALPRAVLAEARRMVAADGVVLCALGAPTAYWSAPVELTSAARVEAFERRCASPLTNPALYFVRGSGADHVLADSFPIPDGRIAYLAFARCARDFTDHEVAQVGAMCTRLGSLTRFTRRWHGPTDALPLTAGERRVLACIAQGLTDRATARRLGIAEATVRKHLEHIYRKLGSANRVAAAVQWLRANEVTPAATRS